MFTPSSLTVSKTMWLTLKQAGHKKACSTLLYSFCVRQFLVQIVLLDLQSEIHIGLQWCDNYCSTWTKTGTLINFSKPPNKKNSIKICAGAWVLISRHIQTNKHTEAKRHTVTKFHYKYAKEFTGSFLETSTGIIFSAGTTEIYAKPP